MDKNIIQFPEDPCGYLFPLSLDTKIREKALPKIAEEEETAESAFPAVGQVTLPEGKWTLLISEVSDELFELMMNWPPGTVVSIESFAPPPNMSLAIQALKHLQIEHFTFAGGSQDQLPLLAELPSLRSLDLSFMTLTTADAAMVVNTFKQLEWLDLSFATIEAGALARFASLTGLRFLDLEQASIEGVELPAISSLAALEYLGLSGCDLGGGLSFLRNLLKLKYLKLSGCSLALKSLAVLSSLKQLQVLDLSHNSLSDPILNELSKLARLEHLNLSWNELQGAELALKGKSRLISLDVAGNEIDDRALTTLLNSAPIENLSISQTSVTERFFAVSPIKNLRYLDISDNDLDETILPDLSACRNLEMLVLSNTKIGLSRLLESTTFPKLRTLVVSRKQEAGSVGPDYSSNEHGFSIKFPSRWRVENHQILAVSAQHPPPGRKRLRRYVPIIASTLTQMRRCSSAVIRVLKQSRPRRALKGFSGRSQRPPERSLSPAASAPFKVDIKRLKGKLYPSWRLSGVRAMVSRVKYHCGRLSAEKTNFLRTKREALICKIQIVAAAKHEGISLQQYVQNSVNLYCPPNPVHWTVLEQPGELTCGALPAVRMVIDQHMRFTPDLPGVTVRVLKYFMMAEHRVFVISSSCAPEEFERRKQLFESTVSSFQLSSLPASFRVIKL